MKGAGMKKVRAVQFLVTPVLVTDDGEKLEPIHVQPITVPAADWPTFATEIWPRVLADAEAQLNAESTD